MKYGLFLPMLLFGFFAFTGGFLALLLPETKGTIMPTNIEDSETIPLSNMWVD